MAISIVGPTEKQIENAILDYLKLRRIFAWKNETTGIYDPKKKVFRKKKSKHHMTGQSDILGIFCGRFLAIEVKKRGGYATKEQKEFMANIRRGGGFAFVARSVDDAERELHILSGGRIPYQGLR